MPSDELAPARLGRRKGVKNYGPKEPSSCGYRNISITVYDKDLAALDALVARMRGRGFGNANRSLLIRAAIAIATPDDLAEELEVRR